MRRSFKRRTIHAHWEKISNCGFVARSSVPWTVRGQRDASATDYHVGRAYEHPAHLARALPLHASITACFVGFPCLLKSR